MQVAAMQDDNNMTVKPTHFECGYIEPCEDTHQNCRKLDVCHTIVNFPTHGTHNVFGPNKLLLLLKIPASQQKMHQCIQKVSKHYKKNEVCPMEEQNAPP